MAEPEEILFLHWLFYKTDRTSCIERKEKDHKVREEKQKISFSWEGKKKLRREEGSKEIRKKGGKNVMARKMSCLQGSSTGKKPQSVTS